MAAANLKSVARIGSQIRSDLSNSVALTVRRAIHNSVYQKNPDDHVSPSFVPSDMEHAQDKYWAPHPHTGVFGPESDKNLPVSGERGFQSSSADITSEEEGKAWFRATHIEDTEKPHLS